MESVQQISGGAGVNQLQLVPTAGIPFQSCGNLKILKLSRVSIGALVFDTQPFPNCRLLESLSLRLCTLRGLLPSNGRP